MVSTRHVPPAPIKPSITAGKTTSTDQHMPFYPLSAKVTFMSLAHSFNVSNRV